MRQLVAAVMLFACIAAPLHAQEARLDRLDPRLQTRIATILSRAEDRNIPTEPLIQKALEGASKNASADVIERAVNGLAQRMHTARQHLGDDAQAAELVAAASALFVGVPPTAFAKLKAANPKGTLAMPLVALTFLVQRGAGRDASVQWVESLIRSNIESGEYMKLQQRIDDDLRAGASVNAAAATRVEALLVTRRGAQ